MASNFASNILQRICSKALATATDCWTLWLYLILISHQTNSKLNREVLYKFIEERDDSKLDFAYQT